MCFHLETCVDYPERVIFTEAASLLLTPLDTRNTNIQYRLGTAGAGGGGACLSIHRVECANAPSAGGAP